MTSLIQKRSPEEHRVNTLKSKLTLENLNFNMKYDADLTHLTPLDFNGLKQWENEYYFDELTKLGSEPLDLLYKLK